MKTIISIILFNIGVDILGFPKTWVHKIFFKTEKSQFIRKQNKKISVAQFAS